MTQTEHFRNLMIMAAVDGRMAESELRLLSDTAVELGITDDEFEQAIQDAISGNATLTLPNSTEERQALMQDMIRMMAADGKMSSREKKLFAIAATAFGMTSDDLNQLIDSVVKTDDC